MPNKYAISHIYITTDETPHSRHLRFNFCYGFIILFYLTGYFPQSTTVLPYMLHVSLYHILLLSVTKQWTVENKQIIFMALKYCLQHHHSVFCLTTVSKPPPKQCLHIVRSRASSFKWQYPLLFLMSSSSFLRLLPRLLVTSISPFIFPSIACFRRQFLRKMWPSQLAFRFLISCRIFLCSLTLSNSSSFLTWTKNYYWFLEDTQKYLCLPKKFHLSHFLILFVSHDTNSFCKPCA